MKRRIQGIAILLTGGALIAAGVALGASLSPAVLYNLIAVIGGAVALAGLVILTAGTRTEKPDPLSATLADIDEMSGEAFEEYLYALFSAHGYAVRRTKQSRDYGADLILTAPDGLTAAVQAKRYTGKIPLDAVQECAAARAHYRTAEAWIVTNSYFTQAALDLALSNQVKLISRNELAALIRSKQTCPNS